MVAKITRKWQDAFSRSMTILTMWINLIHHMAKKIISKNLNPLA
jgi:hypothetical protein